MGSLRSGRLLGAPDLLPQGKSLAKRSREVRGLMEHLEPALACEADRVAPAAERVPADKLLPPAKFMESKSQGVQQPESMAHWLAEHESAIDFPQFDDMDRQLPGLELPSDWADLQALMRTGPGKSDDLAQDEVAQPQAKKAKKANG